MEQKDVQSLILITVVILVLFTAASIALFMIFQRRKSEFIKKRKLEAKIFETELNKMKIEIREQTLRNIGWELHDNIGQMLTLAKIQLQSIDSDKESITEIGNTITNSINELRNLSQIINPDTINEMNLYQSIEDEINRLNRLNYINAVCKRSGKRFDIDLDKQLTLFRIVQELINNTVKHAKATKLEVNFRYLTDKLVIKVIDNGEGFDVQQKYDGQGINILKERAKLIKVTIEFESTANGTMVQIVLPKETR